LYKRSYMFQSIWTIFRELMLVLTKVTLLKILPLKYSVKILSVSWFRLCVYPMLCGVRLRLTPHSTGYTHSLNHGTDNILTLYFNGKILRGVTLVRTNMSSLKMVHMD
jgi:hypothetical protein